MGKAFEIKISPEGIAELIFDAQNEKVNTFSIPVLEELEGILDECAKNKDIKVLALKSGKEGIFIAGADLHSFEPAFDDPSIAEKIIRTGHRVFAKLQALPFPTVAIINGACLGGGLECALSCTYRIVSDNPKTSLALPEVNLGIFPGWGGTQRLPRLIGLENGLNMILSGKPVNAKTAFKMGLADKIFAYPFLEEKTRDFLNEVAVSSKNKRQTSKSWRKTLLEDNPVGRSVVFKLSEKEIYNKTKGKYPAPQIALQVVKDTYTLPLAEGLKKEAEAFIANIPEGFAQAKYLISLFFTQEALKKDPGAKTDEKPRIINNAAVLGAGTMGGTLAWLLTNSRIATRLKDIAWEFVGHGFATVKNLYNKGIKNKKIFPFEADRKFDLLSGTIDYSGFQRINYVLEAVTENLELKKKIFRDLEEAIPTDAIVASNTSSLTIKDMAEEMKHPERFVGMHFFNPPNKMPLVEVVAGPKTSPAAIVTAVELSKKLGKTPIVVGDCPGFLVNRIFVQGANEVLYLFQEGLSQETISKKLQDFGMPMDPFLLADEVGNDVAYKVTKSFEKAYGERMKTPRILELMYDAKLYGKKDKRGFYLYDGDKTKPNPEVIRLNASITKNKAVLDEEILPRFTLVMINEAARCLEEGVIQKPAYLDMALIMGIGFPPYRGGLLKYADELGIDNIVNQLEALQAKYGERFKPANLLLDMKARKAKFYSLV